MKPEQASKVMMRMPTRLDNGEGRVDGEVINACTHSIRRGNGHGTLCTAPGCLDKGLAYAARLQASCQAERIWAGLR